MIFTLDYLDDKSFSHWINLDDTSLMFPLTVSAPIFSLSGLSSLFFCSSSIFVDKGVDNPKPPRSFTGEDDHRNALTASTASMAWRC